MIWIDIEESVPEFGITVLVCDMYSGFITLGIAFENENGSDFEDYDEFRILGFDNIEPDMQVTHWMYLPEPKLLNV